MNDTPRGSRLHIAIFGRRNAGKSSLINALTNQDIAIVSDVPGTTTDPVYKSMEILPVGPVVVIDTAGIDDSGGLGELRVKKTMEVLNRADLALLVLDPAQEAGEWELDLIRRASGGGVPVVGILNKVDLYPDAVLDNILLDALKEAPVPVSALTCQGISELKRKIISAAPESWSSPTILGDLIEPGDTVVLVVPIDLAAPRGRLILPQVQTIRDVLDNDAYALVVKERELKKALGEQKNSPRIVVTDSQAFLKADADTPAGVPLTSFSILFARYKGSLETMVEGALAVKDLKPGDRVLIAEACTHHRVEDDIGMVKIPRWLRMRAGGELRFEWSSGATMPEDLDQYRLIVHCGACMINRREMLHRIARAQSAGVPIVNYGVLIAYLHGILGRALGPFPRARQVLELAGSL